MSIPHVLAMRPHFVEKLWGGTRLRELRATKQPRVDATGGPTKPIGESWEVADLPEGSSVVGGGPHDGRTLRDVVAEHGRALVGGRVAPGPDGVLRFPLLVKLIDARDDLSVQVHPGTDYARVHPGTFSKDEAWLILAADAGAGVLHGFKDGVRREDFVAALAAGHPERLLRTVHVAAGDVLRIAPGTMHGIGKGCLLLEVQEPSDTTFRVWDYRRQENGKERALHVEQALAVARFGTQDPPLIDSEPFIRSGLVTERYGMAIMDVPSGAHVGIDSAVGRDACEPAVLFILEGAVEVGGMHLDRWATAIVSACADDVRVTTRSPGPARVVVMTTGRSVPPGA